MTEIAPGMMVECINDEPGPYQTTSARVQKGKRYLVTKYCEKPSCAKCGNCRRIDIDGHGWCVLRFRPIGGDKEIEIEQFKKLGFDKMLNHFEKVKAAENAHK